MTKKLVLVSNFDVETVNDVLLADNVAADAAEFLCQKYNERFCGSRSTYWCQVKSSDYKLHVWEP